MGAIGPWQIILVIVLALLLFGGRGRVSSIMGDFAKGIKSFRKGMQEEDEAITKAKAEEETVTIDAEAVKKAEETEKTS